MTDDGRRLNRRRRRGKARIQYSHLNTVCFFLLTDLSIDDVAIASKVKKPHVAALVGLFACFGQIQTAWKDFSNIGFYVHFLLGLADPGNMAYFGVRRSIAPGPSLERSKAPIACGLRRSVRTR